MREPIINVYDSYVKDGVPNPVIQVSKHISSRIAERRMALLKEVEENNKEVQNAMRELKVAASLGDLSENAQYEAAKNQLKLLMNKKAKLFQFLEEFNSLAPDSSYISQGFITLYSTVVLERPNGVRSVWKVLPTGMSDISIGMLSSKCRVYSLLKGREIGDTIKVQHEITGAFENISIIDLY